MTDSVHFSSQDHTWETPHDLFALLDHEFNFVLDVCAVPTTAKCRRYFTPHDDGLAQSWSGVCWMNPPYGREIVRWVAKAHRTAASGQGSVICLVPARTDTRWWWDHARFAEVRFLPGRLKFGGAANSAPFPSAILVFRSGLPPARTLYWNWRALAAGHQLSLESLAPMGKAGGVGGGA